MRTHTDPIQVVYRARGEAERTLACAPLDPDPARTPTVADLVPVTQVMTRKIYCARPDLDVDSLADLMVRNHIGCIPVVNELGGPTGIVTKLDLVERLLASSRDPSVPRPLAAREVMMPLALTLNENATVAHVAAMMAIEDIHHVPIVDREGRLIGIVSTMDITRWLATNDGFVTPSL